MTWTYFNHEKLYQKLGKNSFPLKIEKGTSCWMFLSVVTAFCIGYSGWGKLFPPYSPNLKSPFPESLGGIPGGFLGNAQPSCKRDANHVFVKEV
jgi:hypothetical protein